MPKRVVRSQEFHFVTTAKGCLVRPRFTKFIFLGCFVSLITRSVFAAPPAGPSASGKPGAQTTTSSSTISAAALSRIYEERAQQTLERFIPAKEFSLNAQVKSNNKKTLRAPYDPKSVDPGSLQNMSPEELDEYIAKVEIDVLITKRLQPSQKKIEELLSKALKLNVKRGDKIAFSPLGIEVTDEAWTKERSDLKQELTLLKEQNEKLSRDLQLAKTETITEKNQHEEKPTIKPDNFVKEFWTENKKFIFIACGAMIFVFFILAMGLLLMGRSMASGARTLGASIGTIAQAMEGGLNSLANSAAAGVGAPALDAQGTLMNAPEQKLIQGGGGGGVSLSMESAQVHLLKLRQELLDTLNDSTESIILRHLAFLCSSPNTVAKAVVTMELLGRDTSTQLFKRLSLGGQESVLKFLREGTYGRPKTELMFEAGEELKTKLLAESFDKARGAASEKVASRLLQLTDDNLVELLNDMDPELLPRLFLYLDPLKIATLLTTLKKGDASKYEAAMSQLVKMPEAESAENLDEQLLTSLEGVIDKTKADSQRPFLKLYQEIIERASDDDMKEEILKQLSADPRVDNYLKENVITINTFFMLPDDLKNELIESLSNKDVAALAFGVKDEQKDSLLKSLPERRQALINEEMDSLTGKGSRQAQYAFKRVKEVLVRKLNELKADGSLTKALQANKEGGGGSSEAA
jgi:flagellar motor switch protein FliG